MDILKPELVWVEGRCYRRYESHVWANTRNVSSYVEDDCQPDYEDDDDDDDGVCDKKIEIVPHGAAKFKHTFYVPKPLFPFIVGTKHTTRKKLEADTKTTIQIPKPGQDGDIVIIGSNPKGIKSARHRIDLLVAASRKKCLKNYFISIPLNEESIISKFNSFKNDILANHKSSRGISEDILQLPFKLHCTIVMLALLDDAEKEKAVEALDYCKEHFIMPVLKEYGPVKLCLRGLDIMNDDPAETRVLYMKVTDENGALQKIGNAVANYFEHIGLAQNYKENVNFHVTVMNQSFKDENGEQERGRSYGTFDVSTILDEYKDTFFGETILKELHISQRYTAKETYYQALVKINLLQDS